MNDDPSSLIVYVLLNISDSERDLTKVPISTIVAGAITPASPKKKSGMNLPEPGLYGKTGKYILTCINNC